MQAKMPKKEMKIKKVMKAVFMTPEGVECKTEELAILEIKREYLRDFFDSHGYNTMDKYDVTECILYNFDKFIEIINKKILIEEED